jgi:heme A synthase
MPNPSSGSHHDPLAGVVDRLLAQLPSLREGPSSETTWPTAAVTVGGQGNSGEDASAEPTLIGLCARLLLVLALGIMMVGWPYDRTCGLPLYAYAGAVAMVILGGGWAAITAWKLRVGLAHVVSLILVFWGLVLAADALLPRIGYAGQDGDWQCEQVEVSPAFVSPSEP